MASADIFVSQDECWFERTSFDPAENAFSLETEKNLTCVGSGHACMPNPRRDLSRLLEGDSLVGGAIREKKIKDHSNMK